MLHIMQALMSCSFVEVLGFLIVGCAKGEK